MARSFVDTTSNPVRVAQVAHPGALQQRERLQRVGGREQVRQPRPPLHERDRGEDPQHVGQRRGRPHPAQRRARHVTPRHSLELEVLLTAAATHDTTPATDLRPAMRSTK